MLQEIKQRARDLAIKEGRLMGGIDYLLGYVSEDRELFVQLSLLQGNLSELEEDERQGVLTSEQIRAAQARLLKSFLEYLGQFSEADRRGEKGRGLFHEYHRYTCDRMPQNRQFQHISRTKGNEKARFYYIYGLDRHSHFGLVQRFCYDLMGVLKSHFNPDLEAICTVEQSEIIPVILHQDLEYDKIDVISSLFVDFELQPDHHEPLLTRNLNYFWHNCPRLHKLTARDQVACYLVISEDDWNDEITPQVVRWLIDDFCGSSLPPEAPTFHFFFGIEFYDNNSPVREKVKTAIRSGGRVDMLEELHMVKKADVRRWFNMYRNMLQDRQKREALLAKVCGDKEEFFMDEIEEQLLSVIQTINPTTNR